MLLRRAIFCANRAGDFQTRFARSLAIGRNPARRAVLIIIKGRVFLIGDITLSFRIGGPQINNGIEACCFSLGSDAIDGTANNNPIAYRAANINSRATATAFIGIGCSLLIRQTALINAAPWRRCGRIARRIGKTFNHQAAGNNRANINGDAVFAAHVNITALAVIAANCAVNVNAASVVPAHTNQR